jgi:SulP family sulfate permease
MHGRDSRAGRFSLASVLPLVDDLRRYDRDTAVADGLAGIITAILLVPQGMAYALLAGLPPQYGLYAAIAPPILYGLFGTGRTLAVGPVAVAALMVADALSGYAGTSAGWIEGAVVLSIEVGLLLLVAGALGLGRLVAFVSHPVLCGFTNAAALLILLSQAGPVLGIDLARGDAPAMLGSLVEQVRSIDPLTTLTAAVALAALLLGRRPLRRVLEWGGIRSGPAGLITRAAPLAVVIIATVGIAIATGPDGPPIAVVGTIPAGLPTPSLAFFNSSGWFELLPSAALIALIGYVESVTVARVLASRRRERIDPTRELIGLGMANLGAGLVGTMPAAGGFSRSVVNDEAGARTQVAALVTALLVAIVALWFTSWFATLPKSVLATIIVVAVIQLIDVREAVSIGRFDGGDGTTLAITFIGVLVFGIEPGLVAGIAASLLLYVWRTSRPHMAVVGRVPGSEHFRNIERHSVECCPGVVVVRIDENIYFANVDTIQQYVMRAVEDEEAHHLVLAMNSVSYIDSSGVALLERLDTDLAARGCELHLAEVKGPVTDRLGTVHALSPLLNDRLHLSLDQAMRSLGDSNGSAAHSQEVHP